jgi:uncharacterized protein (DUF58 family)
MGKDSGIVAIIAAVIIVLVILAMVTISLPRSQPIVSLTAEIHPQTFSTTELATLTTYLENHDQEKPHSIRLRFIMYDSVHLMLGTNEITKEAQGSGNYTYSLVMQSRQKIEQPFNVVVSTLPTGISKQEFSMTVQIFIDGEIEQRLEREITFEVRKH